jgi:short-subunit dehydrogenase
MKLFSFKNVLGLAGVFALGAHLINRKKNRFDFFAKIALVTGGSRGLGLSLAWNLLAQGSSVALVARDKEELERAKNILLQSFPDAEIVVYTADITKPTQLKNCIDDCKKHFGRIDILVNNAGSIVVAPFAAMELEDFEAQMKLHLYAAINAIKFVVPYFQQRGTGRILNICSLGGKFAVPHMSSYDASKFALAGFAQGIQPELAAENIFMTTAYPTVMRTGSPIQAVFKGNFKKEFKIFEALDNAPGLSMSADKAAKQILKAVEDGKAEVVLSAPAKLRVVLGALFPNLMNAVSGLMLKLLPKDDSHLRKTGADSTNRKTPTKEEKMYNQWPHHDAEFNMGLK